jgi:hypothetical protein
MLNAYDPRHDPDHVLSFLASQAVGIVLLFYLFCSIHIQHFFLPKHLAFSLSHTSIYIYTPTSFTTLSQTLTLAFPYYPLPPPSLPNSSSSSNVLGFFFCRQHTSDTDNIDEQYYLSSLLNSLALLFSFFFPTDSALGFIIIDNCTNVFIQRLSCIDWQKKKFIWLEDTDCVYRSYHSSRPCWHPDDAGIHAFSMQRSRAYVWYSVPVHGSGHAIQMCLPKRVGCMFCEGAWGRRCTCCGTWVHRGVMSAVNYIWIQYILTLSCAYPS